jgi:hypothetical protein
MSHIDRPRMELTDEPDIRPVVSLFYRAFRDVGVPPLPAAEAAIAFISNDILHRMGIAGLNFQVAQRLDALDNIIDNARKYNQTLNARIRIAANLSILIMTLGSTCLLLVIIRMLGWL